MASDGFDTTLVTGTIPPGEGDMSYFARQEGVEPLVIPEMSRELSLRDLVVIGKLLVLFWKIKPAVIHTHKAKAGAAGRIAAFIYRWATPSAFRLRPRPCVVVHTFHGHIFHGYYGRIKTGLFLLIERLLARCTDRIVVISQQQRREIQERYHVGKPEQFSIIPLGLDLEMSHRPDPGDTVELAAGVGERNLLVGIAGRLCEVKNHVMFLEAAARLLAFQDAIPLPVRFVIVGDGPLRPMLESCARKLGIADRVTFAGFRRDAESLYPRMDVVALTSVNEGTPLTLIEAMAAGRPVASTEVGGVVDIMGSRLSAGDGYSIWEHGVTARTGDIEGFVSGLRFLLCDCESRRRFGNQARAFVHSHHSKKRLVSDIENLYRELRGAGPIGGQSEAVVSSESILEPLPTRLSSVDAVPLASRSRRI